MLRMKPMFVIPKAVWFIHSAYMLYITNTQHPGTQIHIEVPP